MIVGSECLEGMELVEEWSANRLKEVAARRKELKMDVRRSWTLKFSRS